MIIILFHKFFLLVSGRILLYIKKPIQSFFYIFLQENSILATKFGIFSLCVSHHSNLQLMVRSVLSLVRGHDAKKNLRKRSLKKAKKMKKLLEKNLPGSFT
jgi:hypothetical protein